MRERSLERQGTAASVRQTALSRAGGKAGLDAELSTRKRGCGNSGDPLLPGVKRPPKYPPKMA